MKKWTKGHLKPMGLRNFRFEIKVKKFLIKQEIFLKNVKEMF